MNKCIILIGVKHSGKTTAGQLFASGLEVPFFDIDHIIEKQTGKTCRELYTQEGVVAFQKAEEEACKFFVEASNNLVVGISGIKCVVAAGGGVGENTEALKLLKSVGIFAYLDVPKQIAFERILQNTKKTNSIPATFLYADPQGEQEMRKVFYEQYERRSEGYRSLADIIINTEGLSPEKTANELIKKSISKS